MMVLDLGELIEHLADAPATPEIQAAIKRLDFLQDRILGEMQGMSAPQAPYSSMVYAWLRAFKARLLA